jgi:hypothetical protein
MRQPQLQLANLCQRSSQMTNDLRESPERHEQKNSCAKQDEKLVGIVHPMRRGQLVDDARRLDQCRSQCDLRDEEQSLEVELWFQMLDDGSPWTHSDLARYMQTTRRYCRFHLHH